VGDGYKDGRKRKPCTFFAQGRRVTLIPLWKRRVIVSLLQV
jgi:hypothetical protein